MLGPDTESSFRTVGNFRAVRHRESEEGLWRVNGLVDQWRPSGNTCRRSRRLEPMARHFGADPGSSGLADCVPGAATSNVSSAQRFDTLAKVACVKYQLS